MTEEVWSWWREGSIHRSRWPSADEPGAAAGPRAAGDAEVYDVAASVLTAVRKEKALAKVSLRIPVVRATVHDTPSRLAKLALAAADVREAGNIESLETVEADAPSVEVVLGEPVPKDRRSESESAHRP